MTLFRLVGFLQRSRQGKTYKFMYDLEELLILAAQLKNSRSTHVLLGLVQRKQLHDSIHAFPSFPVEISQFINAYSLDRKSSAEILNAIPLADPQKLAEKEHRNF